MPNIYDDRSIRLGILGCGWISEFHGRAAAATEGVELVAACDVRKDVAQRFAEEYRCEQSYADLTTMIREHDLDAVVIATWPTQHHEQLLECLDAGIGGILCEKALAPDVVQATEILEAARRADARVVEGFMWRHHPAVAELDGLLGSGQLGTLDYVRAQFDFFDPQIAGGDDPNRNWRQRPEVAGGVPWDVTCYCVDACNRFADALPVRVSATIDISEKYGTVDRLHGWIEYENGVRALLGSTLRTDFNYGLQISGSKGHAELQSAWRIDGPSEVVVRHADGLFAWTEDRRQMPAADPYHLQLEHFASYMRGQHPTEPALEQSVVNICTIAALVRSGREHGVAEAEIPAVVADSYRGAGRVPSA